ncbi:MAG: hypothetical protein Ct9H90mP7_0740 [Candidatus Neomarinimicrobiota bacterium]|nr:MAG: hypothetical protein Ct9H90mP7_0740 [Candidatus Neomarinimicrobiota bacterium]
MEVLYYEFWRCETNHATGMSAFNTASLIHQRGPVPIVFICEDNGIGISVPTEQSWIEKNFSKRPGSNILKLTV